MPSSEQTDKPDCRCTADETERTFSSSGSSQRHAASVGDDNGGIIENSVLSGEERWLLTGQQSDGTWHQYQVTGNTSLQGRWLK